MREHGKDNSLPRLFGKDLGLTDQQIQVLSSGERDQWGGVFSLRPNITKEEARAVPVLNWTRALLEAIGEKKPQKRSAVCGERGIGFSGVFSPESDQRGR